jgi:cyclase
MSKWQYTKGLHDLGTGCFAYLQPDGSWGFSNAGLIVDGDQTLLVDTLFDLALTGEMLGQMRAAVPAAKSIGRLVNTHANGDHTFGNQLVAGAEIIASRACAEEMKERPAEELAAMQRNWRQLGEAGAFLHEVMGSKFKWDDVKNTLPTQVFEDELQLKVGDKEVLLKNVGPAHTRGDILVHVPQDRTVFTGDILFVEGHPVLWAGPVDNWVAACDRILAWDVETVVPGHGPITDKTGVQAMKDYLLYIKQEARKRFDAGMPVFAAARDIALDRFAGWGDPERMVVNVASLYREFGTTEPLNVLQLFGEMGRFHAELKARTAPQNHASGHQHAH